jgi:ankyrin repeat protein
MDFEPTPQEKELVSAIEMGRVDLVEGCLGNGAGIYSTLGYSGERPLHIAARCGQVAVMELLLSKGAPVDIEDERGDTPLAYAADKGTAEAVQKLLAHGADPNHVACTGRTPLFAATLRDRAEIVTLLLENGANPDIQANGSTALHFAAGGGHCKAARALVDGRASVELRNAQGETAADVAKRSGDRYIDNTLMTAFLGAAHVEKQAVTGTENAIQVSRPLKLKAPSG